MLRKHYLFIILNKEKKRTFCLIIIKNKNKYFVLSLFLIMIIINFEIIISELK